MHRHRVYDLYLAFALFGLTSTNHHYRRRRLPPARPSKKQDTAQTRIQKDCYLHFLFPFSLFVNSRHFTFLATPTSLHAGLGGLISSLTNSPWPHSLHSHCTVYYRTALRCAAYPPYLLPLCCISLPRASSLISLLPIKSFSTSRKISAFLFVHAYNAEFPLFLPHNHLFSSSYICISSIILLVRKHSRPTLWFARARVIREPAMSDQDEIARSIVSKIEREKTLITAANQMRQSTSNPLVLQGLDTKIRDGRKNIEYLEGRLQEHRTKLATQRMGEMNVAPGAEGSQEYGQLSGGTGIMPPSAPFAKGAPGQSVPKARPNYSRLGTFCSLVGMFWT
jgi:hypothetical protein